MGGSGGSSGSYSFSQSEDLQRLREQVLGDISRQQQDIAVNQVLGESLASFNDRDVELISQRLEDIQSAFGDEAIEVDRLLFGGSVAKHTYVDGLSDVDALVVLNEPDTTPDQLVDALRTALRARLDLGAVADVSAGNLAVTVTYRDGNQIQLLPAVERDGRTSIASEDGSSWRHIRPHKFAEKLTEVNRGNGDAVVPTIKLAKAVFRNLPERHQLSGYHIEAIAVDAFRSYDGRRDRASMLIHLVDHAARAVLKPTGDITKQSVHIDQRLGAAGSAERRAVSASLERIKSQLERKDVEEYRRLLND